MKMQLFLLKRMALGTPKSFSRLITLVCIAAVALSLTIMIVSSSLVNGFQQTIEHKVFSFWAHVHVLPYSLFTENTNVAFNKNQEIYLHPEKIKAIEHIQKTGIRGGLINTKDAFEGILLKGAAEDFNWNSFNEFLVEGNDLRNYKGERSPILLSENTAKKLKLHLGDKITISFMEFPIKMKQFDLVGIYNSGLEEFDRKYAMVDLSVIQSLNNWPADSIGGFEIFVKPEYLRKNKWKIYYLSAFGSFMSEEKRALLMRDGIDDAALEIEAEVSDLNLSVQSIKELEPGIFDWLMLQNLTELFILLAMFVVAILNLSTALLILILERTELIGLLKAMGAANAKVKKLFLANAAVIILLGMIVGNIIGLGLCYLQQHFQIIKLPPESYYVSVAPVLVEPTWVIAINLMVFVICLLSMIIPIILVSRLSPVRAIRFK